MSNTPNLIGYQIADENGINISGDDNDPSGLPSYAVMTSDVAQAVIRRAYPRRLRLYPIFEDDIEDFEIIS